MRILPGRRLSRYGRIALSLTIGATLWSPTVLGLGISKAFAYTCPAGWSSVSDVNVPSITQMCTQAFFGWQNGYFIKAPSPQLGQWTEQSGSSCTTSYAGTSGNPNPQLFKRSVSNWLSTKRGCGYDIGLVINGGFFNDTSANPTSSVSFPFKYASGPYVTGNNTSVTRYCIGIGGTASTPARALWHDTTGTWTNVGNEFNTAQPTGCKANTTYHQVVGEDPTIVNDYPFPFNGGIPRTYIGKATSGNNVCILVGGSYSNATANSTFATFGCDSPVQLDGGKSSQLSYWTNSSTINSPVTGCCADGGNRPVPHVIVIWR